MITIEAIDIRDARNQLGLHTSFDLQVRLDSFRDGDVCATGGGWVHHDGEIRRFDDPETLNGFIAEILKHRKQQFEQVVLRPEQSAETGIYTREPRAVYPAGQS